MSKPSTWDRMSSFRKSSTFGGDDEETGRIGNHSSKSHHESQIVAESIIDHSHSGLKDTRLWTLVDDGILSEPRLAALVACDHKVVKYEATNFLSAVVSWKGRSSHFLCMIAAPLFVLLVWATFWILLLQFLGKSSGDQIAESLNNYVFSIESLMVPVSFLLVFRLGRAAVRYWDARAACGKLVEMCRTFISTAAVGCSHVDDDENDRIIEDIARWLCVLPIAVKGFLRADSRKGWEDSSWERKKRFEIGPLLADHDAELVLNSRKDPNNYGTVVVLNRLRALAFVASSSLSSSRNNNGQNYTNGAMFYRQLNEQIDTMTGAWGAMERINATPLPNCYVAHLRTFLFLYLLLWYTQAVAQHSWMALPYLICASWGLLGIEAAAVECERPFQWHSNHLALGNMCVVISRNVAQTLKETHLQKRRQHKQEEQAKSKQQQETAVAT